MLNLVVTWIVIIVVALGFMRFSARWRAIPNPRLGFLDLTGGAAANLMEEDRQALEEFFSSVEVCTDTVPSCDVLFLYATLGEGGALEGTDRFLRATIRDSGAQVVVVASENPVPKPTAGKPTYGQANLVITLARNGASFPRFFRELFERMKRGTSMPVAWVKLAPQNPNLENANCPSTLFACEVGGVSFR